MNNDAGQVIINSSYLKNGNIVASNFEIEGKIINIKNTCAFDTVSEIILNAYSNFFSELTQFINAHTNNNMSNYNDFISLYAREGPSNSVYERRACILFDSYNCQNRSTLDCNINIFEIYNEVMDDILPLTETTTCFMNCPTQVIQKYVIDCPCRGVWGNGFINLQNFVNSFLNQDGKMFGGCYHYSSKVRVILGPYVCIDVTEYFARVGNRDYRFLLKDIPTTLNLNLSDYVLVGAAAYKPGHYVAYCRSPSNIWDKRDDMNHQGKRIFLSDNELQEKLKFDFFFYVKSSTN